MIPVTHSDECADVMTSSSGYAHRFSGEIGAWLLSVQESEFRRLLRGREGDTAIDVGGGHGQLIKPLRDLKYRVTVLGSDPQCRAQIEPLIQAGSCSFIQGLPTEIPVDSALYSLVTCIRFIAHCEAWKKLIGELCRVSGRYVLIDYPPLLSGNLLTPITFRLKKLIEGNTRPYSIFLHREIEHEFAHHGFQLIGRGGLFLLPMGLHRLHRSPHLAELLESIGNLGSLKMHFGSPTLALFERVRV